MSAVQRLLSATSTRFRVAQFHGLRIRSADVVYDPSISVNTVLNWIHSEGTPKSRSACTPF
jgi:hypothetical protein